MIDTRIEADTRRCVVTAVVKVLRVDVREERNGLPRFLLQAAPGKKGSWNPVKVPGMKRPPLNKCGKDFGS